MEIGGKNGQSFISLWIKTDRFVEKVYSENPFFCNVLSRFYKSPYLNKSSN